MKGETARPGWEAFVRRLEDLREGEEIPLIIRDLSPGRKKYQMRHVIAVLRRGAAGDGDDLCIRTVVGVRLKEPWKIRIVCDLPLELPGDPYQDVYQALKAAAAAEK
jgi:hypothetical protein